MLLMSVKVLPLTETVYYLTLKQAGLLRVKKVNLKNICLGLNSSLLKKTGVEIEFLK